MEKRVLIVDDDKEFLGELEELLASSGYEMTAVGDSDRVLDVAGSIKPDVILIDLRMPGKSGFQIAHELRLLPDLTGVPIIAMSGYCKDEYQPLLRMCGINVCLRKPFPPLEVITQIERVM